MQNEGIAEIARFTGTVQRYGVMRNATLDLITVYEPWNPGQDVKSESRSNAYALKQNQVLSYNTGVYPYRQMNSLFWNAENQAFIKASMTSQEWCGQTFKELRTVAGKLRFFFNSYWEGEASGTRFLEPQKDPNRAFLYDELPLLVRSENLPTGSIKLFPMLMSSQVKSPYWDIGNEKVNPGFIEATIERNREEAAQPGFEVVSVHFELGGKNRVDRFYIDENRRLIKWERNDGGVFTLTSTHRAKYWELNGPGAQLP